jgi:integrase
MPIAKKKNSLYLWYDFRYRGTRYRGSTKETSKAAARHFEAQLIAKLELGDELPVRGRRAPLLRDFLSQFLASFDRNQLRAEKTKLYYRTGARLLRATALAEYPIDRITTSTVAGVQFPHSSYTANNAIRTLRRALTYGVEQGHLRTVPRMHLHKEIAREQTFTPEQEVRLLAMAPQPLADVFVILMDTGMRPEEVCRIRWEDILWVENMLKVTDGKTNAARREIGMSTRVVEVLTRRVREQSTSKHFKDTPWVFPSRVRRNAVKHIVSVNKAFALARDAAGLSAELVPYSARHTFGTEFMAASKDLKLTMRTMGQVDVKTAMRYQHPETGQVSDIMNSRNAQRKSVTSENGHTFGHSTLQVQ